MIEISEKILIHSFPRKFAMIIFLIKFQFRLIDLFNYIFQLFQSQPLRRVVIGIVESAVLAVMTLHWLVYPRSMTGNIFAHINRGGLVGRVIWSLFSFLLLASRLESLKDRDVDGGSLISPCNFNKIVSQLFVMSFDLTYLANKIIFLLPHPFQFLLHHGILIDYRMLVLKLVVISLFSIFLFLIQLHPGKRQGHF